MTEYTKLIERLGERYGVPDLSTDRLLNGRDRKRRNQRIAAGVVGITVFVAAVWIVTSISSLDRSETSVVPAVSGTTGPGETGSTVTQPGTGGHLEPGESFNPNGPAQTGSAIRGPYEYDRNADYFGLPPEGAEPSGPERSELVAEAHELHVGWVYVFEDGRVISASDDGPGRMPPGFIEQRLSPEGVELVRSGVIQAYDFICFEKGSAGGLPIGCQGPLHKISPSAWEDSTLRPYVPYRYAICAGDEPLRTLPVAAQDLLRGKEATFDVEWTRQGADCFDVTTNEARKLDAILADAGFYRKDNGRWIPNSSDPELVTELGFEPILPHGTFGSDGGG